MFDHAGVDFILAELHTGFTLSRIALDASDERKRGRNRANARKAYDALLHFLPTAMLSDVELTEVKESLAKLRSDLQLLGEEV
jgi:hypothetical protein